MFYVWLYRGQVLSALDELRTITTHDDNLERQYKEGECDAIHTRI